MHLLLVLDFGWKCSYTLPYEQETKTRDEKAEKEAWQKNLGSPSLVPKSTPDGVFCLPSLGKVDAILIVPMIREMMPSRDEKLPDEEDSLGLGNQERRKIGPLSDYADMGEEFYPAGDVEALLTHVDAPRNPDEEVRVSEEREVVEGKLAQVSRLIEKEKEKERALGSVRQSLGSPHEKGSRLKELEKAKKKLEEDKEHIELAATYNHTLEEFGDTEKFSSEDISHVMETGKRKDGTYLKDKHGNTIESNVAKKLAHLYHTGGRQMTWGSATDLREIREVADRVIGDMTGAIKGVLGLDEKRTSPSK